MTRKFLFAKCSGAIQPTTLWVDVMVGSSVQDQRDLRFIEDIANTTHDIFFRRYDVDVTDYINHIREEYGVKRRDGFIILYRCTMKIRRLRKLLRSNQYDTFAALFVNAETLLRQRKICDNDVYALAYERASHLHCLPTDVINLKSTVA